MVDLAGVGEEFSYYFTCNTLTTAEQVDQNPFKTEINSLDSTAATFEQQRDLILTECQSYVPTACTPTQRAELTAASDKVINGVSGVGDLVGCSSVNNM